MKNKFLTAEWRKLILVNYEVDPKLLLKYLPKGTELDFWNGKCYVSLVAFLFRNTRIKGLKIPFHVNFEEANLRFYVKHKTASGEWRRGVVFIKEIVPKAMITLVANMMYHEHYQTLAMSHEIKQDDGILEVKYQWKNKGNNDFVKIKAKKRLQILKIIVKQILLRNIIGVIQKLTRIKLQNMKCHIQVGGCILF